jgi:hypothetical protein
MKGKKMKRETEAAAPRADPVKAEPKGNSAPLSPVHIL